MVNSRILHGAALAACLFVAVGCKGIAGITDRTLVEDNEGGVGDGGVEGGDADVEVDAPIDTSCELPPAGAAGVRLGNLIPTLDRVDFCIKLSSQSSFEGVEPTIASWGGGCQVGLGYRDVTASFGSEPGVFDIAAVQVDGTTNKDTVCSGTPIATASQVVVEEGELLSVLLFGDGLTDAVLRTAPESRASSMGSTVRFMHGLVGAGNLDCGVTLSSDLPTQIATQGFTNVPFASAMTQTGNPPLGTLDANGYISVQLGGGTISLGAASTGSDDVLVAEANSYSNGASFSAFALGRMNDNRFPPEMYICDEQKTDSTILARCGGLAIDLRVDTFNAQLAGPFGPWDAERAPKMAETLNGLDTDAICVHEVWAKAHRDQIGAGTASTFPHSVMFDTDLDTVVDDPTDANGDTPPPYDQPPCIGDPAYAGDGTPADPPSDAYLFSAALDCVRDNCFEPKADETGGRAVAGVSDCMLATPPSGCLTEMLRLVGGDTQTKTCFACLFNGIASFETPEYMREQCMTNPKARFVYRGSTATQVLSRYPIVDPESWVLPATDWRVNVIRAPLKLPNEARVDLYCTQLTTPADGPARPYTGQYGDGEEGLLGWQNELYLQAEKLVSWVQQKSTAAGRMAIISGSFYSGPEFFDGEKQVLSGINETAYNTLAAHFSFTAPEDYVPACTYCNDNPILEPGANTRQSHNFLSGIPVTAIRAAEVVKYPFIVDLTNDEGTTFQAPVTTHYGLRSTLRIVR